MKKALCFFLAIAFVCCVYCYREDADGNKVITERFSFEEMFNNLSNFQDIPTLEDITECWTLDYYTKVLHIDGASANVVVYYESYTGDEEIFEFFDTVRGFFNRLFRTIKLFAEVIVKVFDNVQYLLPWNNTVPVEVTS